MRYWRRNLRDLWGEFRMRHLLAAMLFGSVLVPTSYAQMTYYLQRDLGVEGFQRNCQYSNGKVYAVNSTKMCPLSIQEEGYLPQNSKTTGFKAGEYSDGLTKVCVYNVLGNQRAIRLNNTELCPLTYDF